MRPQLRFLLLLVCAMNLNIPEFSAINLDVFAQNRYKVIFDQATVKFQDPEYLSDVQVKNVMINRTERAFSCFYCVKQRLFGKSFKINIKLYKMAYNVARDLLLQFDVKICDLLKNDAFGAKKTLESGNATTCPVEKGCYKQENFAFDSSKFPPFIPANVYQLDLTYYFEKKRIAEVLFKLEVKYGI